MRQEKLNRQSLPYKVYAPIVRFTLTIAIVVGFASMFKHGLNVCREVTDREIAATLFYFTIAVSAALILWQRRIGVFLFIIASYLYYRALHSFFSQDAFASLQEQISLIVHVIFVATVLSARKDGKSAWRVLFPQKD